MLINLPTGPLRTLVMIAEVGSMKRAADRVFLTQSALSLQMKRLENLVQAPIFSRQGKALQLTPAGETLLAYARQILSLNDRAITALTPETFEGPVRVGVVQDFAETLLSGLLSRFVEIHPQTQLQVRVGGSDEMREMLDTDRLDLALCLGPMDAAEAFQHAPMLWLGERRLVGQEVLPLALLAQPCIFRTAALSALEAMGRRYRILIETPNVSALHAAVQSGIALTCRAQLGISKLLSGIDHPDLPELPEVSYVMHSRQPMSLGAARLFDMIKASLSDLSDASYEDEYVL